jgi:hypothetical protein
MEHPKSNNSKKYNKQISRRDFLKFTGTAAIGAGF